MVDSDLDDPSIQPVAPYVPPQNDELEFCETQNVAIDGDGEIVNENMVGVSRWMFFFFLIDFSGPAAEQAWRSGCKWVNHKWGWGNGHALGFPCIITPESSLQGWQTVYYFYSASLLFVLIAIGIAEFILK